MISIRGKTILLKKGLQLAVLMWALLFPSISLFSVDDFDVNSEVVSAEAKHDAKVEPLRKQMKRDAKGKAIDCPENDRIKEQIKQAGVERANDIKNAGEVRDAKVSDAHKKANVSPPDTGASPGNKDYAGGMSDRDVSPKTWEEFFKVKNELAKNHELIPKNGCYEVKGLKYVLWEPGSNTGMSKTEIAERAADVEFNPEMNTVSQRRMTFQSCLKP